MAIATDSISGPQPLVRDDIRARLEPEQVVWLESRLERQQTKAAIAYRVSTALFGHRFYIALLAGRELRSTKRIQQQGLKRAFGAVVFELAIMCFAATVMVCTIIGFGFGLFWLLDQAFGITDLPEYLDKLFH